LGESSAAAVEEVRRRQWIDNRLAVRRGGGGTASPVSGVWAVSGTRGVVLKWTTSLMMTAERRRRGHKLNNDGEVARRGGAVM
jgi:hypothetical protein